MSIGLTDRLRHTYSVGVTGTGKSTQLLSVILDDASNGLGLCVVDPHGDLSSEILARLPASRLDDLVYISLSQPGLVPKWNPFRAAVPSGKFADDMSRAFEAAVAYFGVRMEHIFRHLCFAVHQMGGTLDDLSEMAGRTPYGERLREGALEIVTSSEAKRFLQSDLPQYKASDLDPVRNKLSRLLLEEQLGAMFRQRDNELEPREWLDEGKLVLVDLGAGLIGADHARFVGGLLVSLIYRAALSRADTPPEERRPFLLFMDEFQLLQSGTLSEIVSEARKYRLGAFFAHQEGGQLEKELAKALGNCGTTIVFRPTPDDLPRARKALLNQVPAEELSALGVGEAFVAAGGRVASLKTQLCSYPVLRDPQRAASLYARENYVPVESISALEDKPRRRPRVYDTFENLQPKKGSNPR